jgi:predicted negative regulator of RcsB-dependent stress response
VEVYNSEQEQVEALKAWWDKNGRQALVALVAFLLAVLGWQAWNDHRNEVAAAASSHYQQMTYLFEQDPNQAKEAGRALIANYPDSIYATMASMMMARLAVEEKDLDAAAAHLRSAMKQSAQAELAQLARLRLARVELAQGKSQLALATVNGGEDSAASDELRGDILMAMGNKDEARAAYSKALEAYGSVVDKRDLVQMKLDDLNAGTAE